MSDSTVLGGKPCIRGTRISVEFLLELIASGASTEAILRAYPQIPREDVAAAVNFAANLMRSVSLTELEISG